jgi:hypothetical protein
VKQATTQLLPTATAIDGGIAKALAADKPGCLADLGFHCLFLLIECDARLISLRELNPHQWASRPWTSPRQSLLTGSRPTASSSYPASFCEQLTGMQRAFQTKLRRLRWNNFDGYQTLPAHG